MAHVVKGLPKSDEPLYASDFDNVTLPQAETYAENHTTDISDVLRELSRETHLKTPHGRMLSGVLQGRLLQLLCKLKNPQSVLEIGTFTGYSAIAIGEVLAPTATLTCIEINPEYEDFIRKYTNKAGLSKTIELIIGNALQIIPTLKSTFDLIFLDADKVHYPEYYDLVMPKLTQGGLLVADNVLWSGQVWDAAYNNKEVTALRQFNDKIQNDSRVTNLLLPLRDGLMIVEKTG
ncbi:O-methyltransferase [Bacteroidia bacterium]|nr:O-methyltransferase [Bacteroidia bacterium]